MSSKKNMFQKYIQSGDEHDASEQEANQDFDDADHINSPKVKDDAVTANHDESIDYVEEAYQKTQDREQPIKDQAQYPESNHSKLDIEFQTAAKLLETRNQMKRISTGCKAFDKMIGGGIEPKSTTEFYGAYTTGKTQMSMQLAFNTALPVKMGGLGADVVYIDSEGSFRPERITQMANEREVDPKLILDRILIGRAHNSDVQMKLVDNVLELSENKNIKLLIVDSLTSTFRAEYIGKSALMERQQKLNQHMRQLSRIADILNVAVIITNQVSSVIDGFENTVIPVGGNIIAHGSTHRIHFKKSPKRPQMRIANLVASPSYPNGSAAFEICQAGVRDIEFASFIPTDEND